MTMAMTTVLGTPGHARVSATPDGARPSRLTQSVGRLCLWTSGVNGGIVVTDPSSTGHSLTLRAAGRPRGVIMASPAPYGSAVALGELVIGLAPLRAAAGRCSACPGRSGSTCA